jgi:hypothetical protein
MVDFNKDDLERQMGEAAARRREQVGQGGLDTSDLERQMREQATRRGAQVNAGDKSFFEEWDKAEGTKTSSYGNFNVDDKGINLDNRSGKQFTGGDFKMDAQMMAGMEGFGKDLRAVAEKNGIDLAKTKEFKGADFNGDGKIDDKEIGAVVMAANMTVQSGLGGVAAVHDNEVSADKMQKLLDPKSKAAALEIAKQLLGDNGVKVGEDTNSVASNNRVVSSMANNADITMRC